MYVPGSSLLSRQMQISKDSFGAFRRYIGFVSAECVDDDSEIESKEEKKPKKFLDVSSSPSKKCFVALTYAEKSFLMKLTQVR
jgi:hypothetical protein